MLSDIEARTRGRNILLNCGREQALTFTWLDTLDVLEVSLDLLR